jgi:hypothetical protein
MPLPAATHSSYQGQTHACRQRGSNPQFQPAWGHPRGDGDRPVIIVRVETVVLGAVTRFGFVVDADVLEKPASVSRDDRPVPVYIRHGKRIHTQTLRKGWMQLGTKVLHKGNCDPADRVLTTNDVRSPYSF